MVRALNIVLAAVLISGPVLCARPAYAEPTELEQPATETTQQPEPDLVVQVDQSQVLQQLDTISIQLDNLTQVVTPVPDKDEIKTDDENEDSPELTQLKEINDKVGILTNGQIEPEETELKPVKAAANVTVVAYGNVSPTSQYAHYAAQIVPKMQWNDDYVFVQTANSEYYLFWGDLSQPDSGTITGTAMWVRWYFTGNTTGYVMQDGSGQVSISTNGYTVLSTKGNYPLLDDGTDMLHKEVTFYALVACALFSLRYVWAFLVRMRGSVVSE